jgi:phage terminase small subunit
VGYFTYYGTLRNLAINVLFVVEKRKRGKLMANETRGKPLTDKQEKFVLGVSQGMTQADAYRQAYNASKMTDKSIHELASKLMTNTKIKSRFEELRGKVVERMEKKAIVTIEGLLQDLQMIKETSLSKLPIIKKTENGEEQVGEEIQDPTSAIKAIELMGKHLKMFTDKIEHSGEVAIVNKTELYEKYLKED